MSKPSLIRQLFWRIVPAILITILATGVFAFRSSTNEINKAYDAQLINNANILWGLMGDEIRTALVAGSSNIQSQLILTSPIRLRRMKKYNKTPMITRMTDVPHLAFGAGDFICGYSGTATEVKQAPDGFSYEKYDHNKWRVYTLGIPGQDITIEVGEKTALREELVKNILIDLFFPFLIVIPVIGILTWFSINNGLATMRALVKQIRLRSSKDLSGD